MELVDILIDVKAGHLRIGEAEKKITELLQKTEKATARKIQANIQKEYGV